MKMQRNNIAEETGETPQKNLKKSSLQKEELSTRTVLRKQSKSSASRNFSSR